MTASRNKTDLLRLVAPEADRMLQREEPHLADRLRVERGFSIESVRELYRHAGGQRWKPSVAELDTSSCARTLLDWLEKNGLLIYSRRALSVAGDGDGNGTVMTRDVLRQLHGDDTVAVIDKSMEIGAAILARELDLKDDLDFLGAAEPLTLDGKVRVANAHDVKSIERLKTWAPSW